MNPARDAEELLAPSTPNDSNIFRVQKAQVYATLALAQAVEGVGLDIKETLRSLDVEVASIAQAVDNLANAVQGLER